MREDNQYADVLAKMGVHSVDEVMEPDSSPDELQVLLLKDADGAIFLRI